MNILYVGSPQLFKEGASSIHVARMCEAFVELNHNVELILPINKNELESLICQKCQKVKINLKIFVIIIVFIITIFYVDII